ncbi:hypothetical protein [Burkholderia sp. MBR-1]|uniref:hypothetical protein n=1 Tax=Burkholderia sp. MBR-1 TaxID=2732364 RepID=UPI0015EF7765|nr:hypothetical protein [Burkholderia sp. MBR-1]QMI49726.1 hypothetical protein MBR110_30085 [Burkholderia sp. MBR-1]
MTRSARTWTALRQAGLDFAADALGRAKQKDSIPDVGVWTRAVKWTATQAVASGVLAAAFTVFGLLLAVRNHVGLTIVERLLHDFDKQGSAWLISVGVGFAAWSLVCVAYVLWLMEHQYPDVADYLETAPQPTGDVKAVPTCGDGIR